MSPSRCNIWSSGNSQNRSCATSCCPRLDNLWDPIHHLTLSLSNGLATALAASPEGTRDDPRVNQPSRAGAASTVFNLTPGDDRLQAESIAQDVLSRRRRVFGPAHPATRRSESLLSQVRSTL